MMRWAIQTNLGKVDEIQRLAQTCRDCGQEVAELKHIPFSDELPDLDTEVPTVFYGATSFVTNIAERGNWSPGVFFHEPAFRFGACLERLGSKLLNSQAQITTLGELALADYGDEKELFLRPVADTKAFAGNVWRFGDVRDWVAKLERAQTDLSPLTEIVVSEPVGLAVEWRVFLVDGRAVAGSQYRQYHRLVVEPGLSAEVALFAEQAAALYSPAPVFVADITRSGDNLYVVEYNCFNSCGFYAADLAQIVRAVSGR